jgi:hypothetical protein
MQYGKKKLFIDINRAGKVTEKLSAGQRLASYEPTHKRCGFMHKVQVAPPISCKLRDHKVQAPPSLINTASLLLT